MAQQLEVLRVRREAEIEVIRSLQGDLQRKIQHLCGLYEGVVARADDMEVREEEGGACVCVCVGGWVGECVSECEVEGGERGPSM